MVEPKVFTTTYGVSASYPSGMMLSKIAGVFARSNPQPDVQTADSGRRDLGPAPIEPNDVRDGQPVARSLRLSASPDGRLVSDLWDCTAGRFDWIFGSDEIVKILEGEVHITDDTGAVVVLGAGDTAHFRRGAHTIWYVPSYVRKFAINRLPVLVLTRARVRRMVASARSRREGSSRHER